MTKTPRPDMNFFRRWIGPFSKPKTDWMLFTLPLLIFVILVLMMGVIGYVTYESARENEHDNFKTEFKSAAELLIKKFQDSLVGASERAHLFGTPFKTGMMSGTEFHHMVNDTFQLADYRGVSFNALIQSQEERHKWEDIAINHTDFGPGIEGRMPKFMELGISWTSSTGRRESAPWNVSDIYVPVHLIQPLVSNELAVGFDIWSSPSRRSAIKKSMETKKAATTEIIHLVQDTEFRAASLMISPILNDSLISNLNESYVSGKKKNHTEGVLGFIVLVFNFDNFFQNVTSTMRNIDVVLSNDKGNYSSYRIDNGVIQREMSGKHYDESQEKYAISGFATLGLKWTATVYPTTDTIESFYTENPEARLGLILGFFSLAILLTLSYFYVSRNYEVDFKKKVMKQTSRVMKHTKDKIVSLKEQIKKDVIKASNDERLKQRESRWTQLQIVAKEWVQRMGEQPENESDTVISRYHGYFGTRNTIINVTVHQCNPRTMRDVDDLDQFLQEACILSILDHHKIMRLHGFELESKELQLTYVSDRINGTLQDFARNQRPLYKPEIFKALRGVATGVLYLHNHNIIHKNIAAGNVAYCNGVTDIKLQRFGSDPFKLSSSTQGDEFGFGSVSKKFEAVKWAPVETVTRQKFSRESDVWSFGVLAWELETGLLPWENHSAFETIIAIAQGDRLTFETRRDQVDSSRALQALIKQCWEATPEDRPTFERLLSELGEISQLVSPTGLEAVSIGSSDQGQMNQIELMSFGKVSNNDPTSAESVV
eukprot:m.54604 g.54604  ORF g.54604 m.54604 type:complete len:771 (+) comp10936_c1_seq2:150-2462(+)